MAWTNIPNAALLIDKPWTSSLALAVRDNPISIAAGNTGAPKNHPASLDIYKGTRALSGTTPQQYLNLDRCVAVRVDVGMVGGTTGGAQFLEASYSNNNGSSWGSYQTLDVSATGAATDPDRRNFVGMARVNLTTGAYIAMGASANGSASPSLALAQVASGTHTVPSNCNAVRFRMSAGTGTAVIDLVALSGVQG